MTIPREKGTATPAQIALEDADGHPGARLPAADCRAGVRRSSAAARDSGKTLFGLEFLVRGATQYDEPGVFTSFFPGLSRNAASLGFDLNRLVAEKKLFVDYVEPLRVRRPGNR